MSTPNSHRNHVQWLGHRHGCCLIETRVTLYCSPYKHLVLACTVYGVLPLVHVWIVHAMYCVYSVCLLNLTLFVGIFSWSPFVELAVHLAHLLNVCLLSISQPGLLIDHSFLSLYLHGLRKMLLGFAPTAFVPVLPVIHTLEPTMLK